MANEAEQQRLKRVINACLRAGRGHILNGARRLMVLGEMDGEDARFATDYHSLLKRNDPTYARRIANGREPLSAVSE